ncbi:hypothetical protein [Streptomyces sp. V1I6]|uniref:hypothetical protein n=1 Tax=Streptomyces sp. V1I6 TaxID=3042273 RepID=UPI0027871EB0|nr:hypothetical protein [Streptomyces sp. V1I6]MDQ0842418.1 hypothetical protein [Streptomyces sp. V1I6]
MNQLPDRLPTHVGQPQPLAGWPIEPTMPAAVELYGERPAVAWVQDPYNPGRSVAIDARLIHRPEALPARDLTPQPLIDPIAARILSGGVGGGALAAGVGWGVGQAAAGIAAFASSGAVMVIALLLLAAKLPGAGRGSSTTQIHNEIHNHTRWLGKTTNNL